MNSITQLEIYANELACAARSIVAHCQNADVASSGPQLSIPEDAPEQIHQNRRKILANVAKIQVLLGDSEQFVQRMAMEIQMLANVQWLSSLQVLICLPFEGTLAIKDLAQLSGVQEKELASVLRLTASRGFLQESQPGQIMHTPLSSQFVSNRRFRDATTFLAECATPSALCTKSTMQHSMIVGIPRESGYQLAFSTSVPFAKACSLAPRLQRQCSAFLQFTGNFGKMITEVLTRLDWGNLGDTCIVETGAQSTETARLLSELYPTLQIIVQIEASNSVSAREPAPELEIPELEAYNPRITVQTRAHGTPQPVVDAAAFILHLPSSACGSSRPVVLKDLQAYCAILSGNRHTMLIVTARMLPPPGSVDHEIEALARMRDLTLYQLGVDRDPEVAEVVDLVSSVGDSQGRLVVVDRLQARNHVTVALAIKYQGWSDLDAVLLESGLL